MKVLWLQSGGCGGCTQSLLCSDPRPLFDELRDAGIEFLWHPGLSLESGEEALAMERARISRDIHDDLGNGLVAGRCPRYERFAVVEDANVLSDHGRTSA